MAMFPLTSAVAYVRLSEDLPPEQEQLRRIQEFAEREHYSILRYYVDRDGNRKQFERFWEDQDTCYDSHALLVASMDVIGLFTIWEAQELGLASVCLQVDIHAVDEQPESFGACQLDIASGLFEDCVRRKLSAKRSSESSDDRRQLARRLRALISYVESH